MERANQKPTDAKGLMSGREKEFVCARPRRVHLDALREGVRLQTRRANHAIKNEPMAQVSAAVGVLLTAVPLEETEFLYATFD